MIIRQNVLNTLAIISGVAGVISGGLSLTGTYVLHHTPPTAMVTTTQDVQNDISEPAPVIEAQVSVQKSNTENASDSTLMLSGFKIMDTKPLTNTVSKTANQEEDASLILEETDNIMVNADDTIVTEMQTDIQIEQDVSNQDIVAKTTNNVSATEVTSETVPQPVETPQIIPEDTLETPVVTQTAEVPQATSADKLVIVGDSRTVGMESVLPANIKTIAKVGKGYRWLVNEADSQIHSSVSNDTTLIFNLGVNDLANAQKYIDYLYNLQNEFPGMRIICLTVGPVGNTTVTNADIDKFNQQLKATGFEIIDVNQTLQTEGFESPDGLHYTKNTYQKISDMIVNRTGI